MDLCGCRKGQSAKGKAQSVRQPMRSTLRAPRSALYALRSTLYALRSALRALPHPYIPSGEGLGEKLEDAPRGQAADLLKGGRGSASDPHLLHDQESGPAAVHRAQRPELLPV